MIERIEDMPEGTVGLRLTGTVSREEYRTVIEPAIADTVAAGRDLRLLFQVGPGFEKLEAGALWEDAKTGVRNGLGHMHSWKRSALVTDVDWILHAMNLMGWMAPGEVGSYHLDQLEEAKAWVAG
ncbi:MAG: STAS/SEC14 domain-containing protein [Thermoleophilia bacterium]